MSLGEDLRLARRELITWNAFFHRTRADWDRLSRRVYRRWRLPPGVAVEDVRQELMLHAHQAAYDWEPERATLEAFVVWTAINKTCKWLHTQRKALRRDGKAPSRFHQCFAELGDDPPQSAVEPEQHTDLEYIQHMGAALRALDALAQQVLVAVMLARGDLDQAAADVYDDQDLRLALRVVSIDHARRITADVAHRAVAALAA